MLACVADRRRWRAQRGRKSFFSRGIDFRPLCWSLPHRRGSSRGCCRGWGELEWHFVLHQLYARTGETASWRIRCPRCLEEYMPLTNPVDRDLAERAATRQLEFRGFVPTQGGHCHRCGKHPDGSGCLHAVFDPQQDELLEYGVYCFPTYLVPTVREALAAEALPSRKQMLKANLARIPRERQVKRCNVAKRNRNVTEKDNPAPPEDCIGGGYRFVLQAHARNTFTVQVYDDELALLGAALLRDAGKPEDEIAAVEGQLVNVAQNFCQEFLSDTQDKPNCRILRFPVGRLANRDGQQPAHVKQELPELPPGLEDVFDDIE